MSSVSPSRALVHRFLLSELRRRPPCSAGIPNPFLPTRTATRRWKKPRISLRQQSVIVKHARHAGLLHLLPSGPKADQSSILDAIKTIDPDQHSSVLSWKQTFISAPRPGALIGARLYAARKRLFKGHKWQRERPKVLAKRRVRVRDMDKRIHRLRMNRLRYFRNPSRPIKPSKSTKLPF